MRAQRFEEALRIFDEAIEINPGCFYAWQNRGFVLQQIGRLPEALECFSKTIELNPRSTGPWQNQGEVLFCLEKYKEAIECFDKAIELAPENEYALSVRQEALSKINTKSSILRSI